MVCGDELVVFVLPSRPADGMQKYEIRKNSFILYKINILEGNIHEIYQGPKQSIPDASSNLHLNYGDSIIFGQFRKPPSKYVMEFNMHNRTWTRFTSHSIILNGDFVGYSSSAYEPGMNPFIAV
ncbi:hypothetical protein R1flu_027168 [Riccia fluitans]|uniref:Galectin n=1 Tax=Riccia fluitans TaxID=41844 RepID=A0ABD1XI56_9MARC